MRLMSRVTVSLSPSASFQTSWRTSFKTYGSLRASNKQSWAHLTLATFEPTQHVEAVVKQVGTLAASVASNFSVGFSGASTARDNKILFTGSTPEVVSLQKSVAKAIGVSEGQLSQPGFCLYDGPDSGWVSSLLSSSHVSPFSVDFDGLDVILHGADAHETPLGKFKFGSNVFLRSSMYINGHWTLGSSGRLLPSYDPATSSIIQHVPAGNAQDIDTAVQAAKAAFPIWSAFSAQQRAKLLVALADEIAARVQAITLLETIDNGKPLAESKMDVDDTAACFRYYADQILQFEQTKQEQKIDVGDDGFNVTVRYDPVGVCGLIVPWNYPILMAAWKLAPCLAAGCTLVLKPSELTPLSALELAAICDLVGFPPGVVNVVTGYGLDAGAPLAEHPAVDKVAFTGSVPTGSRIMEVGAKSVKKVTLELGGKSPIIVCKDADIDQAVDWVTTGIFFNAGQVCSATSRLILHQDIKATFINRIKDIATQIKLGNGQDETTKMGPLVSKGQYERVLGFINSGLEEGATLVCGGVHPQGPAFKQGFFVAPTIFADVQPHMKIWREEIFGPVLAVSTFSTEDEAIHLANDSIYGLGAAVLSQNKETCERIAKKFQAGIIWINCSQPTLVQAPWGGVKKSGTGRELGPWGLMNYLETKQITRWVNTKAAGWNWFTPSKL